MSNTAGEIAKFFLNKSWVIFALSLIAGFFTAILIPAEWRNSIPLENNDLRVVVTCVVAWAIFYVVFSGVSGLFKVILDKKKRNEYKHVEQAIKRKELKDFLTASPDKFYYLVEFLVNNGNPWTYVFVGMDYTDDYILNTVWFQIEDAPEKKKVNKRDGKVHQESIYTGRRMLKLQDWLYKELVATIKKTGYLTHKHRGRDPYDWEIVKDRKERK